MSKYMINNTVSTTYFSDDLSEEEKIRCTVLEVLKYIRTEIEALYDGDVCAKEHNCDKNVLDIIDRKVKEIEHD